MIYVKIRIKKFFSSLPVTVEITVNETSLWLLMTLYERLCQCTSQHKEDRVERNMARTQQSEVRVLS